MRKHFLAYALIITRYARDRDRSMGVTKRALLYVRAPYVRTYAYIICTCVFSTAPLVGVYNNNNNYNQCARTHETETREQNETARKYKRDRTGRRMPVKRHGTKASTFY